jgi:hypothetical protein
MNTENHGGMTPTGELLIRPLERYLANLPPVPSSSKSGRTWRREMINLAL